MNPYHSRTRRPRWTTIPGLLAVLALVSLLVGCGGPTPTAAIWVATVTLPPQSAIRVETATFTAAPSTPPTPAEAPLQEVQPCSLVTQQEAEAILGEPATPPQAVSGGCAFTNAKDGLYAVSVAAAQDKQTGDVMQGQAFLLGMAGVPLDQAALDQLKALSDAQDFKGFFTELVARAQGAPAVKAQLLDGVGDVGYWAWLSAQGRRQGAFVAGRGPTLVNVNLVVADSQSEQAMLDAARALADQIFGRLPARFTIAAPSAAPTPLPSPVPPQATDTPIPPAPAGTSAPPPPPPTPTATATPTPSSPPPPPQAAQWTEVPGEGTTDVSVAAVTFKKTLYLFSKGIGDNRIYVNASGDGTNWTGAKAFPSGGTTDVTPAAAVLNDTLYLFGKGIGDKRIYVSSSGDGTNWSPWKEVPGGSTTDVFLAATAFNDQLYLFGKGIGDQRIYVNSTADGANWTGWKEVPGGGTTDVNLAVSASNNILYLFSKGIGDQRIYVNSTADGVNWTGAREVPGGGTTDVGLAAVALKAGLYLFGKGVGDRRIYMNFTADGTNWTGWREVPGGGTTNVALATSGLKGTLYVFAKGIDDNRIYVISGIQ